MKIDGTCPYRLRTTEKPDGTIKAVFHTTHFGHDDMLGKTRLSKTDREKVAGENASFFVENYY